MKIFTKEIDLSTNKNINNKTIICFSDLHYSKKLGVNLLDKLFEYILLVKPDYICFLGDLINDNSFDDIYMFFDKLRHIAPVLFIEGNHDLEKYSVEDHEVTNKNPYWSKEFGALLGSIPGVYLLKHNTIKEFDNITFTGTDFYHHTHEIENIKFLNQNVPNINQESYNVLLAHSPYIISKKTFEILDDSYKDFDVAFTGHIHNALMPPYVDNHIKRNIGIYTKDTGFFPNDYLGEKEIIFNNNKSLIRINVPPIRTFNQENIVFNSLNKLYPPSVRLVKIKKATK